ncbi:hypothetical protein EDC04DRAFT_2898984 [Pisolithus marmoratus]|nr:hypothetical protein EDC04DRAFT_2898984 [Pisolithus marmoratus]
MNLIFHLERKRASQIAQETKSRYLTPETEVIDAWQMEPHLPMVEVGTGDSKLLDKCMNMSEAPDKGSQCIRDNVEVMRSPKPNGIDLDMSNGHMNKPNAVPDTDEQLIATDTSMKTHDLLSEHDCKAIMPMTSSADPKITYTAGVNAQMPAESNHQIANHIKDDQHFLVNGKTIVNVPDPSGMHPKPSALNAKCSMLQNRLSVQTHSTTITELKLPCT